MLKSFCAAANTRGFLNRPDCPPVLKESAKILERCGVHDRGVAIVAEIRTLGFESDNIKELRYSEIQWTKRTIFPERVRTAMRSIDDDLRTEIKGWPTPKNAFFHERHTIRGVQYTTYRSLKRDSCVFFLSKGTETLVPGVIQEIFSVMVPSSKPDKSDYYTELYFLVI
jgi:hypothetical protein